MLSTGGDSGVMPIEALMVVGVEANTIRSTCITSLIRGESRYGRDSYKTKNQSWQSASLIVDGVVNSGYGHKKGTRRTCYLIRKTCR